MKDYKKEYQRKYMALDIKPKGKWKHAIEGSNRMKAKKAQKKALDELARETERLKLPFE